MGNQTQDWKRWQTGFGVGAVLYGQIGDRPGDRLHNIRGSLFKACYEQPAFHIACMQPDLLPLQIGPVICLSGLEEL